MTTEKEFLDRLEWLKDCLLRAQLHLDIAWWLWSPEDSSLVKALEVYRGFFIPTRLSHIDCFAIKIAIAIEQKDRRQPSIYFILKAIQKNPSLASGIDVASLRDKVDSIGAAIGHVEAFRKQRAAHLDMNTMGRVEPSFTWDEAREALDVLKAVFNEVYKAVTGAIQSFTVVEHKHTEYVLRALTEHCGTRGDY